LGFSCKRVFDLHVSQFFNAHGWESVSRLENLLLVLRFQSHPVIYIVILNEDTVNFSCEWVYVSVHYFFVLRLLHLLHHPP
jgi:hypothetical protein